MTKEFILSEIRRVAAELGRPPGRREITASTGIKESDWYGRFWPRWGDALTEAGFEPNKAKTAHPEDHLLESLVRLIRERERFPTRPEMRIKRRTDPTFPDPKTFERFGNRTDLIKRLSQYCASKSGYSDIIEACEAALVLSPTGKYFKTAATTDTEAAVSTQGYVYMLKSGRNQFKIGRTNSPTRRHREVALNVPYPTDLVHSIATDDPSGIEAYWHKRFEDKRIQGTEFFKLDMADVSAFKRRKFM